MRGLPPTRSTDQQGTPVALTTGVPFPAHPSRPVPLQKLNGADQLDPTVMIDPMMGSMILTTYTGIRSDFDALG